MRVYIDQIRERNVRVDVIARLPRATDGQEEFLLGRAIENALSRLHARTITGKRSVRAAVSFGVSFSRQTPILMSRRIGSDARFAL